MNCLLHKFEKILEKHILMFAFVVCSNFLFTMWTNKKIGNTLSGTIFTHKHYVKNDLPCWIQCKHVFTMIIYVFYDTFQGYVLDIVLYFDLQNFEKIFNKCFLCTTCIGSKTTPLEYFIELSSSKNITLFQYCIIVNKDDCSHHLFWMKKPKHASSVYCHYYNNSEWDISESKVSSRIS